MFVVFCPAKTHKLPSLLKCCWYKPIVDILPDMQAENLRESSRDTESEQARQKAGLEKKKKKKRKELQVTDTLLGSIVSGTLRRKMYNNSISG